MGKTTANLPLRTGEHYERCPSCATVYRSKRTTRFRCPSCHRLTYALPVPEAAGYARRSIEGDPRTFRVYPRRGAEGETPDPGEDSAAMWLEDDSAAPVAPDAPASPAPGPNPDRVPTATARRAAGQRERGASRLGRIWRGSLGDWLHRG